MVGRDLLYWHVNFFDPDRFFSWLEPKIRFVWTRGFAAVSLLVVAAALVVLVDGWHKFVGYLPSALRWETLVLVWLTLVVATFLHEFAHGLTCKHYGGEVHEVGFLLMFGMPCFYCNVSDAWLFPEKSQAAAGDARRRLLRPVRLGAGRLRLAADAAGEHAATTWPTSCSASAASASSSTSTRSSSSTATTCSATGPGCPTCAARPGPADRPGCAASAGAGRRPRARAAGRLPAGATGRPPG